jgi:hypothetical protein
MSALLTATGTARWYVRPEHAPGRHRAVWRLPSLDDLLGRPSEFTEYEHAPAPIESRFAHCATCGRTTAGSLNKDGWLCGEFSNHPAGGA